MAKQIKSTTTPLENLLPLIPLRDIVIFPGMVAPLFVGRHKSILAIEKAVENNQPLVFVAQKDSSRDNPDEQDVYNVGVIGNILQLLKLPDNTIKILIEAQSRVFIKEIIADEKCLYANTEPLNDPVEPQNIQLEALSRAVLDNFIDYVQLNKKVNPEILNSISEIKNPSILADSIASHILIDVTHKQEVLKIVGVSKRLDKIALILENEISVLNTEKKIRLRIKKQMEKVQKDYYLNEQMKAIQKELTESESGKSEFEEIEDKISKTKLSKEAFDKIKAELKKLKSMNNISAEASMVRNYIEMLLSLPWNIKDKVKNDLKHASNILDNDHYGLEKVKERILEYLAVQQRVKQLKGPILCLVGPPGVGKTSLGESIARATNRTYVRMALGGVRDEAEIRGHRRTYIGSMPGKILQSLAKVKTRNPMFLLDEIDKMAADFRGDPASALLEVLDPEQNHTFSDHYLEVDFDLSDVMFVATANTMNIPSALLDRMEVIRLAGYTEDEKINIAIRYLIPKQIKNNGLEAHEIEITEIAVRDMIRYYSREAGVRNLERDVSKICRKVVKSLLLKATEGRATITPENLGDYLGVRRFNYGLAEEQDQVGQVTGLAWTEVGGELLTIETAVIPGKGKHSATGKLGDVMKESIEAAMTVVRSRSAVLGIDNDVFQNNDIHIHVPEGATPKDGPSAGIGMCTAIISALTKIPVRANVAMTGEITLRGEVLPIGGLKEKLLAAHRGGITTVLIPADNEKDLIEIPENIKQNLDIRPVHWIDEVLSVALQYMPIPLEKMVEGEQVIADAESAKPKQSGRMAH